MVTKTTIEMAREAAGDDWGLFQEFMPEIHRLAELVRADERARMAEQPTTTENNGGKTGWPPGLLQDDCKGLSKWLSNRPDAKRRVREALAEQPAQEPVDSMGVPLSCGKPLCSPCDHHLLCKLAEQEPTTLFETFDQYGEGWERLAWELCAEEHGEDACSELIWEGGPIPEPWGDRWLKYEDEAKRLIALVHKCTTPQPPAQPLTNVVKAAQSVLEWTEIAHRPPVRDTVEAGRMVGVRLHALADLRDALAAHGIKGDT